MKRKKQGKLKNKKRKQGVSLIAIGCDHGGFEIKQEICLYFEENGIIYKNFGTNSLESVDYPKFAEIVSKSVTSGESEKGILICGTGIGISIAANKIKGVRAALCHNSHYAQMARKHNNANVLCLGGRELSPQEAIEIVKTFLNTEFEGGRHQNRILQISEMELREQHS